MTNKPYILIADDDQEDRYLLDMAFKEISSTGDIRMVENGVQVIDYLNGISEDHFLPNLIVLDLNMPVLSGMDTLLHLKSNKRFKDIPVIIHSTSVYELEKERCLQIGAAGFIKKPVNFDQMVTTAKLLERYTMA